MSDNEIYNESDLPIIVNVDDRIQLHPATDHWARGDRFGTIAAICSAKNTIAVRLDVTGRLIRVTGKNVYSVNGVVVA